MTQPTDRPLVGQLDLHGFDQEEATDFAVGFADSLTRLREERERLDLARVQYRTSALQDVAKHTRDSGAAGTALDVAVTEARGLGATWEQIGEAAGMTRQSAWRRWHTAEEVTEP